MQIAFYVIMAILIFTNLIIAIIIIEYKGINIMFDWRNIVAGIAILIAVFSTYNYVVMKKYNNELFESNVQVRSEYMEYIQTNAKNLKRSMELEKKIIELEKEQVERTTRIVRSTRIYIEDITSYIMTINELKKQIDKQNEIIKNSKKCSKTNYVTKKIYISKKCSVY